MSDVEFVDNVGTRALHVLGASEVNLERVTVRGHDIASASFIEKEGEAHIGGGMLFSDYSEIFDFAGGSQKVSLSNVTIEGNLAASGGGLMVTGKEFPFEVSLTDVTIGGNRALSGDGGGAAFDTTVNRCRVTIRNSRILGNRAEQNGGGLSISGAMDVHITGSSVSFNNASGFGELGMQNPHVCWTSGRLSQAIYLIVYVETTRMCFSGALCPTSVSVAVAASSVRDSVAQKENFCVRHAAYLHRRNRVCWSERSCRRRCWILTV